MATIRATVHQPLHTVDDFFRIVPDGQKADLIDGVIYVASPDTRRSDRLTNFVRFLLQGYSAARRLGEVTGSRFAFILTQHRAPEPDVAFVSSARSAMLQERGGEGPPDIAVEVVARDSRTRDYRDKKRLYQEAGVREYWILDPKKARAEFHRLAGKTYVAMSLSDDAIFRSGVLPGFWLDVNWLFADTLPNEMDCLHRILAGPAQPAPPQSK